LVIIITVKIWRPGGFSKGTKMVKHKSHLLQQTVLKPGTNYASTQRRIAKLNQRGDRGAISKEKTSLPQARHINFL